MVEHGYNSSYVEGGGRRILSLMPAWAKLVRPCVKKNQTNKQKVWGVVQCTRPWTQPRAPPKTKKKKNPKQITNLLLQSYIHFYHFLFRRNALVQLNMKYHKYTQTDTCFPISMNVKSNSHYLVQVFKNLISKLF
jgi:hypothetical protein